MTLADTRGVDVDPTTPVGFTPVFKDRQLAHQLDLEFAKDDKNFVVPTCNCGWTGMRRRTDAPEPSLNTLGMVAEYEGHLV